MNYVKKLREVQALVLLDDDEIYLTSKGNRVFFQRKLNGFKRRKFLGSVYHSVSRISLLSRLLRLEVRSAVKYDGFVYIFWNKLVHVFDIEVFDLVSVISLGFTPLNIRVGNKGILFGTYLSNNDRSGENCIYLLNHQGVHALHKLTNIRHVHGIIPFPNDEKFIVLTGDNDSESWIAVSDYKNLELLYSGSQMTRAVSGEIIDGHLIFGTDTPREKNYIISASLGQNKTLQKIGSTSTSVFWSLPLEDGSAIFTTAIEPSDVNTDPNPILYLAPRFGQVEKIMNFKSSSLNKKLWQYPQVRLVKSNNSMQFWTVEYANSNHGRSTLYELKEGP